MAGEPSMVPNDNEGDEVASLASLMLLNMFARPKLLSPSAGMGECCIFRVPRNVVKFNEEAYYPSVVSIGPYHYGEEHLQMLQELKWRFLSALLVRCEAPATTHLLELINAVLPEEERIRDCYSECLNNFGRSELAMMMVLDGCFIIEFLAIYGRVVKVGPHASILDVTWIKSAVMEDLCKLENQIPYFVLEKLFEITRYSLLVRTTLADLVLRFFNTTIGRPSHVIGWCIYRINAQNPPVKHLLDMYWRSLMPQEESYERHADQNRPEESYKRHADQNGPMAELIQSTQMLRQAGIKFRRKEWANSFLEISFYDGTLEIPFFLIDDYSHIFLLNFVAFEQCQIGYPRHITSYIVFMKCLITSAADSEYLESKQIIEKCVGTHEEVTRVFNHICKNASFSPARSYLLPVFGDINEYSRNKWRAGWGSIKQKYFGAPWAWIAALGALLGLLLTAIQTVFSVLGYLNAPNK